MNLLLAICYREDSSNCAMVVLVFNHLHNNTTISQYVFLKCFTLCLYDVINTIGCPSQIAFRYYVFEDLCSSV